MFIVEGLGDVDTRGGLESWLHVLLVFYQVLVFFILFDSFLTEVLEGSVSVWSFDFEHPSLLIVQAQLLRGLHIINLVGNLCKFSG